MLHPLLINENYVKYDAYESSRLVHETCEQKLVPGTGPKTRVPAQIYHELPLKYRYTFEDDFIIEGCPMDSMFGIRRLMTNNRMTAHLIARVSEPHFLDTIYKDIAGFIFEHKGMVGMRYFNPAYPEAGFNNPVYRPMDKVTCEYLPHRNAHLALKLRTGFLNQTIFADNMGDIIPWHTLSGTYIRFIPYIHIKHVYFHCKAHLQFTMVKATVLYFGPLIMQLRELPYQSKYHLDPKAIAIPYIKSTDYDSKLLLGEQPHYGAYNIPLLYNYDGVYKAFLIECNLMTDCRLGIIYRSSSQNYCIALDPKFIDPVYRDCCQILFTYKDRVNLKGFDPEAPGLTGFFIPNRIRVITYDNTVFMDPEGHIIQPDRLLNVMFTMVPLFHIERLHIGLKSAIVTIDPSNTIHDPIVEFQTDHSHISVPGPIIPVLITRALEII
jgi:hypothetical protein